MSLLSNSLFLDSEYAADCKYKINYLSLLKDDDSSDLKDADENSNSFNKDSIELLKTLETKLIIAESTERPYVNDGTKLHTTKHIADEYYKIIIE